MTSAFFYVEYNDGKVTQVEFKTVALARRAFNRFAKAPEDNVRGYGWDTKYETPTLTQQIRSRKMEKA